MASKISDLGNGVGFIYVEEKSSGDILTSLPNNQDGVRSAKQLGIQSAPVASEIQATGKANFTADFTHAGPDLTISAVNIDGVNQFSASLVFAVSKTKEELAQAVRDEINAAVPGSGPDYTAFVDGATVVIVAPAGTGASVNGDTLAMIVSGGSGYSDFNTGDDQISGGSASDDITDSGTGYDFFLGAEASAVEGDKTGALDITNFIVPKKVDSQQKLELPVMTAATNKLFSADFPGGYIRNSAYVDVECDIDVSGELHNIDPTDFFENDQVTIKAKDSARIITFKDESTVTGGNIILQGQQDFLTGDKTRTITLALFNDPTDGLIWLEVSRNPSPVPSTSELRAAGLNAGAPGVKSIVIAAGGGTVELEVGVDPQVIFITGNVTLTSPWSLIMKAATTTKAGDSFFIVWAASITPNGNSVDIFGIGIDATPLVSGTNVGFATFIADGAPGSPFVTWANDHFAAGMIEALSLATDAVETVKIKDLNVTTAKIAALAITPAQLAASSVETDKIDTNAVTVDKVDSQIATEIVSIPVSFEPGEIGEYNILMPYKCQAVGAKSRTNLLIEATDDATIQLANSVGNMANGLITHTGGTAFGDEQTVTPTTNTTIAAGTNIKATTAKTTAGGKAILDIEVLKIT